jgi:hypothetical protein
MDYKDRIGKFKDMGYQVLAIGPEQPDGTRHVALERKLKDGVLTLAVQTGGRSAGDYREVDYSPEKPE